MLAGKEIARIARCNGLHVATDAHVAHRQAVRRTGNGQAVGDGVGRLDHVPLRSVMRAKVARADRYGGSSPGLLPRGPQRHVVARPSIARMMAFQAQFCLPSVGHDRPIAQRHRRQRADQVWIVRRRCFSVRLVAGLAANRRVGGVGRRKIRDRPARQVVGKGVVDPRHKPIRGVAHHALVAASPARDGRRRALRAGMGRNIPLRSISFRRRTVMTLVASARVVGRHRDSWPVVKIDIT